MRLLRKRITVIPFPPKTRKRLSGSTGEAFSFCGIPSRTSNDNDVLRIDNAASLLSERDAAVMVRGVKLPRLVILVLLLPLLLLPGCVSTRRYVGYDKAYYRVRVTNPRGELIADYIAQGEVKRTELGYVFKAVERTSAPPYMMTMRYPRGRRIEVAGPNIIVTPSGKPAWLYRMDGDYYTSYSSYSK